VNGLGWLVVVANECGDLPVSWDRDGALLCAFIHSLAMVCVRWHVPRTVSHVALRGMTLASQEGEKKQKEDI
jgi:hypothetical protein